jgi:hypothetical protein
MKHYVEKIEYNYYENNMQNNIENNTIEEIIIYLSERYKKYPIEFAWEKKVFDKYDIYCKNDTYWFDPVEFENKIYCYLCYVFPITNEIKRKVISKTINFIV